MRLISTDALTAYMTARGESTRTLAAKVTCSHGTIHNLTTGRTTTTTRARAEAISAVLRVPLTALFTSDRLGDG